MRRLIDGDVDAAFIGDPAARSTDEILICDPGAIASLDHRSAHQLDALGLPLIARIISERANERKEIAIHPGATVGLGFFIDHGTGVVIGETASIGARVRLYQHVTLGARAPLGAARHSVRDRHARHQIVEDDGTLSAGATILGRVTIGASAIIGGNEWLLEDVPPVSVVSQSSASVLFDDAASRLREALMQEQTSRSRQARSRLAGSRHVHGASVASCDGGDATPPVSAAPARAGRPPCDAPRPARRRSAGGGRRRRARPAASTWRCRWRRGSGSPGR